MKPTGRGRTETRRMNAGTAKLLLACSLIIIAVVVSAIAVKLPATKEMADAEVPVGTSRAPPPNYYVWGVVKDSGGNPLVGAEVTILIVRTGANDMMLSTATGMYQFDLANCPNETEEYYIDGDELIVEAVMGMDFGSSSGCVDTSTNNVQIDVQMGTVIPEFPMVIAPVAGMLALFAIVRFRRRKAEEAH